MSHALTLRRSSIDLVMAARLVSRALAIVDCLMAAAWSAFALSDLPSSSKVSPRKSPSSFTSAIGFSNSADLLAGLGVYFVGSGCSLLTIGRVIGRGEGVQGG